MRIALPLVPALVCALAAGELPLIRVGTPKPVDFDLRQVDAGRLIPADPRDPAQVEASRRAWQPLLEPLAGAPALRLRLPQGPGRTALLLAAAQALRAWRPEVDLYVGPDFGDQPLLDEAAWGAVDGGALLPEELGAVPRAWRDRLTEAMGGFPGRPWVLWMPEDPKGQAATLLGDGGRLVLPAGGPGARLAAELGPEAYEVEGGPADLTVHRGPVGRRWRFEGEAWVGTPLVKGRTEVSVSAAKPYEVGALLAKMRAESLRGRASLRNLQAEVELDLRFQATRGDDGELGFTFGYFEAQGEEPELLQKEVRFNGVKANIRGEVQLPLVEARTSMALPTALGLQERFRYTDGGSAGPGLRRLNYEPVSEEVGLPSGELVVEEASGRIQRETRERSGLPGVVKSERMEITYGDFGGTWRAVDIRTFERWLRATGGVAQVRRHFHFKDPKVNAEGFQEARATVRASKETMLRQTPEGVRYFTRQADGTRKVEERPKTSGRAIAGVLLVDPGLTPPVLPLGGLALFDFNAFNRDIQYTALIAGIFNTASLVVPRLPLGLDASFSGTALFLKSDERPVKDGKLLNQDAVGHLFGNFRTGLSRELGAGFHLEADAIFDYDKYSRPRDEKYETPGYLLPPSGWTREGRLSASWLGAGFQLRGYHGWGRRPEGTFGAPTELHAIPEGGRFTRWGGTMGQSVELGTRTWLKLQAGLDGGRNFDRFNSLQVGGAFGGGAVSGIRANALAADRILRGAADIAVPTGPRIRLTLGLQYARARSLDDQKYYSFSGLKVGGDLPGWGWFTTFRVDLGIGLQSDIPGVKTVNGYIAALRLF
ncbi:MAG: hypothetical protein HYZ13_01125 [Acidobacteria bacterium]|nr:hypothetical protein [Acidobacteriota bacterium]